VDRDPLLEDELVLRVEIALGRREQGVPPLGLPEN